MTGVHPPIEEGTGEFVPSIPLSYACIKFFQKALYPNLVTIINTKNLPKKSFTEKRKEKCLKRKE